MHFERAPRPKGVLTWRGPVATIIDPGFCFFIDMVLICRTDASSQKVFRPELGQDDSMQYMVNARLTTETK